MPPSNPEPSLPASPGPERPSRTGMLRRSIRRYPTAKKELEEDLLAVEDPLEIRLARWSEEGHEAGKSLSITMRTPGQDFELAAGFLLTEGILRGRQDLQLSPEGGDPLAGRHPCNVMEIRLARGVEFQPHRLERHFYATSSCGVCGKASIQGLRTQTQYELPKGGPVLAPQILCQLPATLRDNQTLFSGTGGLHAAALFDLRGRLLRLREDVGRHNAVDKLIGAELLSGGLPLSQGVLLVSGRTSFEIIQKALMAGLPIVAAVGAPSSLAIELAEEYGMTLIGFLREGRFNVYSGFDRIGQERGS